MIQLLFCQQFEFFIALKKISLLHYSYSLSSFLAHGSDEAPPSVGKIMSVQATGGIIAGATASCITTPLDTIKTRLQVFI